MCIQGIAVFLPTIVRTLFPGRTTVQQQLLTVPPNIMGGISVLATAYAGWKTDKRGPYLAGGSLFVVLGYAIFLGTDSLAAKYVAAFCITTGCFCVSKLSGFRPARDQDLTWCSSTFFSCSCQLLAVRSHYLSVGIGQCHKRYLAC